MIAGPMRLTYAVGVAYLAATVLLLGCSQFGRSASPAWLNGGNEKYPADRYLLGVGQGESKAVAAERAYGAVAKIFKAEVIAQSRDWESFLVMEQRGRPQTERRLTLDHITNVSTDKVLENVTVVDTWHDVKHGQHYALAGMNRAQTGTALREQMDELDRSVEGEVSESRQTEDKLAKIRNLRRAVKHLVLREAYNSDLRTIQSSGRGVDPPFRVAELTIELEQFLTERLVVGVEVNGEQADVTRRAIMEGLIREGLPVTNQTFAASAHHLDGGRAKFDLMVTGAVRLWDVPVADPRFRYVRWCGDFLATEVATQRVVGAMSSSGREGHLTPGEAKAKAIRIMQHELTSNLAKTLAAYIYGETDPPTTLPPSACPKIEERAGPVFR